MAGDTEAEAQLKGLSKYFNSVTIRGRANVSHRTPLLSDVDLKITLLFQKVAVKNNGPTAC